MSLQTLEERPSLETPVIVRHRSLPQSLMGGPVCIAWQAAHNSAHLSWTDLKQSALAEPGAPPGPQAAHPVPPILVRDPSAACDRNPFSTPTWVQYDVQA